MLTKAVLLECLVLWTCEIKGAQHRIYQYTKNVLVIKEQK